MHSFAFAGHMLPGKRGFPQRREKQGKVVAGLRWQGWCSTLFFSPQGSTAPPAYYTLHRCHGHTSAPTDFTLWETKQQSWLWVSFTLH